jgi:hypothetical protein
MSVQANLSTLTSNVATSRASNTGSLDGGEVRPITDRHLLASAGSYDAKLRAFLQLLGVHCQTGGVPDWRRSADRTALHANSLLYNREILQGILRLRVAIQSKNPLCCPRGLAIRKVVLPSIMPFVFAGMRTSLAVSLITTVVAEMIAGHEDIGYYIVSMQYAMRPDMYARSSHFPYSAIADVCTRRLQDTLPSKA